MASLTVKGFIEEFFKGKVVDENERILLEQTLAGKVKGFTKEEESNFIANLNEMVNASPETFYSNGEIKLDKFNSETEKIRMVVSEAREVETGVNATIQTQEVVPENPKTMEELQKIEEMKFRGIVGNLLDKVAPGLPEELKKYLENEAVQGKDAIDKQEELEKNGVPPEKAEEMAGTAAGFDMTSASGRALYKRAVHMADNAAIVKIQNENGCTLEQAQEQYLSKNPSRRSQLLEMTIKTFKGLTDSVIQAFTVELSTLETEAISSVLEGSSIQDAVSKILKVENKIESVLREKEISESQDLTPEESEKHNKDRLNAIDGIVNNYFTTGKSVYELFLELKSEGNPFNIGYETILERINERVESENSKNNRYLYNDYRASEESLKEYYIKLDVLQFEMERAYNEGNTQKIAKIEKEILKQQEKIKSVKHDVNTRKKDFCKTVLGKKVDLTEENEAERASVIDYLFEECKDDDKVKDYMSDRITQNYKKIRRYAEAWVKIGTIRQTAITLVKDKENYKKLYTDVDTNRKNETLEKIAKSYFSDEDSRKSIYDYWKELDDADNVDNISFNDILGRIKKNISDKVPSDELKKWEDMEKKNFYDSIEKNFLELVYAEASHRSDGTINKEEYMDYVTFGMINTKERYKERLFELRNGGKNHGIALAGMKKTMIMGLDSAEKSNIGMQQESSTSQSKTNPMGLQVEELVTNAPTKQRGRYKILDFINKALKRGKDDIEDNMLSYDECNAVIEEFGALREKEKTVGDAENPLINGVQGNQMNESGTR